MKLYDYPRLKYVRNPKNLGLFGNFNRCVELASGDYIHILHSDDYIDPTFTETCMQFLDRHSEIALTFTSAEMHAPSGRFTLRYADIDTIMPAQEGLRKILRERCFIPCPSVMVRRDVYENIGLFSLEYPYSADYYQWLRISRRYPIAYVRDAVVHYRQGEHTESYRLLFASPFGYVDTLKIYLQMTGELGDEFVSDCNVAVSRFSRDCLYAGVTRADTMRGYGSDLLTGLALSAWGLVRTRTFRESAKKFGDYILIVGAGVMMQMPFLRRLVGKALTRHREMY